MKLTVDENIIEGTIGNTASNFACPTCRETLSHQTVLAMKRIRSSEYVPCNHCGKAQKFDNLFVCIPETSASFLDAEVAKETVWFHATIVEEWLESVQTGGDFAIEGDDDPLYVHCGTYEAAADIANLRLEEGAETVDIYEIRITDDAVMSPRIFKDENDWFYNVTEASSRELNADVIRYANRWEAPGSISILADPRKLVQVSVTKVKKEDLGSWVA